MKYTLLINHYSLPHGGIEQYICILTKYCVDNSIRVIWLKSPKARILKGFEDFMLGPNVERVRTLTEKWYWIKHDKIVFHKDEQVVVLSFNPIEMAQAESLVKEYSDYTLIPLYILPDTTGKAYFLERNFHIPCRGIVYKMMRNIHARWESSNAIRFFNINQATALSNNYKISIDDINSKVKKGLVPLPSYSKEFIRKKREISKTFNIITISRYDFPHKGYMLGLIDVFDTLLKKYNNLSLTIVGYGPHKDQLLKKISSKCDDTISKIKLFGEADASQLSELFNQMHLNVSVAGSARLGASYGIPTLVARNYCPIDKCEVYGFFSEAYDKSVSTEPGVDATAFIESVITLDIEKYEHLCHDDYNTLKRIKEIDPLYIFKSAKDATFRYRNKDIIIMKFLKRLIKILPSHLIEFFQYNFKNINCIY